MSDSYPPEGPGPQEGPDGDPEPSAASEEGREPIGFAPAEPVGVPPVLGGSEATMPEFQVLSDAPVQRRRRAAPLKFDFGGVFGNVFKVYARHWFSIAALALLFIGPFALLNAKVQWDVQEQLASQVTPEAYDPDASDFDGIMDDVGMSWLLGLVGMVMATVLGGSVAFLVVRHQQGRAVGAGEAIQRGIRRLLPIAGTMLIIFLTVILFFVPIAVLAAMGSAGLALLVGLAIVFPLVLYALSVYIAAPVCAVEQLGPMASIKRSRALSKGNRGWIFLLYFVIAMIGSVAAMVVVMPFMSLMGPDAGRVTFGALLAGAALNVLFLAPLQAVACSLCYVELRRIKEGIAPEGITDVFA